MQPSTFTQYCVAKIKRTFDWNLKCLSHFCLRPFPHGCCCIRSNKNEDQEKICSKKHCPGFVSCSLSDQYYLVIISNNQRYHNGYKQIDSVIESCRITANLLIGILLSIARKFEALIYCMDSIEKTSVRLFTWILWGAVHWHFSKTGHSGISCWNWK